MNVTIMQVIFPRMLSSGVHFNIRRPQLQSGIGGILLNSYQKQWTHSATQSRRWTRREEMLLFSVVRRAKLSHRRIVWEELRDELSMDYRSISSMQNKYYRLNVKFRNNETFNVLEHEHVDLRTRKYEKGLEVNVECSSGTERTTSESLRVTDSGYEYTV